ncbi:hypothetical protein V5O48_017611, partial [Marasmius crinis-equi]
MAATDPLTLNNQCSRCEAYDGISLEKGQPYKLMGSLNAIRARKPDTFPPSLSPTTARSYRP